MKPHVQMEAWPLKQLFRISGLTHSKIDVVVVKLEQRGLVGYGEATCGPAGTGGSHPERLICLDDRKSIAGRSQIAERYLHYILERIADHPVNRVTLPSDCFKTRTGNGSTRRTLDPASRESPL